MSVERLSVVLVLQRNECHRIMRCCRSEHLCALTAYRAIRLSRQLQAATRLQPRSAALFEVSKSASQCARTLLRCTQFLFWRIGGWPPLSTKRQICGWRAAQPRRKAGRHKPKNGGAALGFRAATFSAATRRLPKSSWCWPSRLRQRQLPSCRRRHAPPPQQQLVLAEPPTTAGRTRGR